MMTPSIVIRPFLFEKTQGEETVKDDDVMSSTPSLLLSVRGDCIGFGGARDNKLLSTKNYKVKLCAVA